MAEEEDFISKILEGDALESVCHLGIAYLAETFFAKRIIDKANN